MSLDTPWQIEQTWGSNQPVLKGITETLKLETGIECGCGYFSTPILTKNIGRLITVEHDSKWVKKVQKDFPQSETHNYIIKALHKARNGVSIHDMPVSTLKILNSFYEGIISPDEKVDFLLVDTFRCARVPAALHLAPKSNVAVIHDVREHSRDYYEYHKLDDMFNNWIHYEHRPTGSINKKHKIPWTAVYTHSPIDLEKINPIIKKDSMRLWNQSVGLEEI